MSVLAVVESGRYREGIHAVTQRDARALVVLTGDLPTTLVYVQERLAGQTFGGWKVGP